MITIREVEALNRQEIPGPEDDISEIIDLTPEEISKITGIDIYMRDANACPLARGNWIIDITQKNGGIMCIKLPKQMKREDVLQYALPLINLIRRPQ